MHVKSDAEASIDSDLEQMEAVHRAEKSRVLLVDDDATLLTSLRRRLQENFDIFLATSAREALTLLRIHAPFAVIVADMTMPETDGATLLNEVKRLFPFTVRLMLTGHAERDVVSRAVNDCEVFRFLSKPCAPELLDRALEEATELHLHWLSGEAEQEGKRRSTRELVTSKRFDATTRLVNRNAFEAQAHTAIATRRESMSAPALMYVDIDNFRLMNESYGFVAGDALLRHVADVLVDTVGPDSEVARLSADKFGVLLRGASATDAEALARRIVEALVNRLFCWNGEVVSISGCVGVAELTTDVRDVTAWLLMAETACSVAKEFGAGHTHVARVDDPQMKRRQYEREWLAKIQKAIEGNRFRLMFQRILPLQTGEGGKLHFELLLRMLHKSGSLMSPAFFMPVAERYHLATTVDRWVIRSAFEWLCADAVRQRRIELCSINLSARSLCDPEFLAFLLATRHTCRIPARKICLEITETATIGDFGAAANVLGDLHRLGFRLALDDFGSGLCSFAYLKHLPVDYVKIDGSFVRQMDTDATSRAMVQSINHIGQVTGKMTVAEFVENDTIRMILTRMGVDFGQGYALHRPAPLETL